MQQLLTIKEVQKLMNFKSVTGVKHAISKGLPVIKIGGTSRISSKDLEAFLEAHKVVKTK